MQLKLNSDKTKYIQFASTKHNEKLDTSPFNAKGDLVELSTFVRYIGGYLDSSLTFKDWVKEKIRRVMAKIIKIKFFTQDAATTLFLMLCIFHLEYANAILYNIPEKTLHKYQTIQNICTKIALNKSKYSRSTKALKTLHVLPIHQ